MKGEPDLKEEPEIDRRESKPGERLCLRTVMFAMLGWLKKSPSGESFNGLGLCVADEVRMGGVNSVGAASNFLELMDSILFSKLVSGGVLSAAGTLACGLRGGISISLALSQ